MYSEIRSQSNWNLLYLLEVVGNVKEYKNKNLLKFNILLILGIPANILVKNKMLLEKYLIMYLHEECKKR